MGEFCDLVIIENYSDGTPACIPTIQWLLETGHSGRFFHCVENRFSQWDTLCALEEALVETRQTEGWLFVVGTIENDDETRGWLIHEDWVVLPYGPTHQEFGVDVGVFTTDDFELVEHTVRAACPVCDESGILLNAQVKLLEGDGAVLG